MKIVELALRYKFLVIIGFLFVIFLGVRALGQLPIDAFPDVTPVQVSIFTESEGLSPEEVETVITFPVESAMAGLPNVALIRSLSMFGLSFVTVFFEEGTDIYFARRLVLERLQEARARIPEGFGVPIMGPNTTGLGQVFQYYLKTEDRRFSLMDLRALQDWTVRLLLRTASGVDDVLSFGGHERQYQILLKPAQLINYGLTLSDVIDRVAANNKSVGGQFIVRGQEEYLVRGLGWAQGVEDLKQIVVKEERGTPVYLKDVAEVVEGPAVRRGAVTRNGDEVVTGIVLKRTGENTKRVIDEVKGKLSTVQNALPQGVTIEPFYDQTELVDKAVGTARRALLEGAILVTLVLFLFLGEFRSALVVVLAVPLAMLIAFFLMDQYGLSANLMSLGGLAIGIGMMVDGAVVMVENTFRLLSTRERNVPKDIVILEAAREVARPVAFAILIIIVVFLPLFALSGIEGKLFKPMALAITFAMLGSLALTMTLIPAVSSLVLKAREERESFLVRTVKAAYRPLLELGLRWKWTVIGASLLLFVASLVAYRFLGTEFVPTLEEGSIQVRITNIPSTSLVEALSVAKRAERVLNGLPEVVYTVSKVGLADRGDVEDVSNIETYVALKPFASWPTGVTKETLATTIRDKLETAVPSALFSVSQPIQMRVDELVSGIRAMLAIKIYGDDLKTLSRLGEEVKEVLSTVKGVTDLQVETVLGKPTLTIQVDRAQVARYGLNVDDVLQVVRAGIGGEPVSTLIDGVKRFEILVRFDEAARQDLEPIANIPLQTPDGRLIPLKQVAQISLSPGVARIRRENLSRLLVVQCNVVGRDIGSFVTEAQTKIDATVKFPPGYYTDWGGQFENQRRAMRTLAIVVPITILLIFVLLYTAFASVKHAFLVIANVPFSVIGGLFALLLSGQNVSVPAAIGFIAVFGVAMLNGVVLVTYFTQLKEEGLSAEEAVRRGSFLRLRPVLMTATVAILGLVPLLLATGIGAEVQRPLATVVVGGLFTSTLLTLILLPVGYLLMEVREDGEHEETIHVPGEETA